MSAAKKTRPVSIVPLGLRRALAILFGAGRTVTLALLVVVAFCGGAWAIWRHVEQHVESSPDYLVGLEHVTITPQPEWVRSDVRAEAYRTASPPDRPLSILDDSLAERVATAFMLHPWVAKATVRKRAGARVSVDIVYRQPVCMVEMATGSTVELLPIDAGGVLLPSEDFSPKQKESYPRLAGIDRRPIQPVGHPWGDARVFDGASIAAALLPVWQQLKLRRIQALEPSPGTGGATFELITRAGTRIVWGSSVVGPGGGPGAPTKCGAPTKWVGGETTSAEKVARLVHYAEAHGGLYSATPLDVRQMPQLESRL